VGLRRRAVTAALGQDGRVSDTSSPTDSGARPSPAEPAPAGDAPRPAINRSLPPDPAAYDSERASLARARGLSAPYIAGGRDPDPETGQREERFYGRILLIMVLVIILGGFLLGVLDTLITALRGG